MTRDILEIDLCAFAGPETAPVQQAIEGGFFADEGLSVRCHVAQGSVAQMIGLIDGEFHMAMSAVDNVVAYMEGQGAATPKSPPDLIAFLGCASDPRPLVARPGIETIEGLRGARIAVDAVNTGFSFLLHQLLEDHGLGPEDYELVPVGDIRARWRALQLGECAAGLLGKADARRGAAAGYSVLGADPDPWDCYQGGVFIARRGWAAAHRPGVEGFVRAVLKGLDWVLAPQNAEALPGLLQRHLPHLDLGEAAAGHAAAALQSADSILKPGLPINVAGLERVLALRRKYGTPPRRIGQAGNYIDLTYYPGHSPMTG